MFLCFSFHFFSSLFSLPPGLKSDPGSHSRLFCPLSNTVRAFHFIPIRRQPFFPRQHFFNRQAWGKKKRELFPTACKGIFVTGSLKGSKILHFFVPSMHEMPSVATPPRELQGEPCLENKMIRTSVSRAIERVKINSMRSNMWDIYSHKGPTHVQKIIHVRTSLPASWAETARRPPF